MSTKQRCCWIVALVILVWAVSLGAQALHSSATPGLDATDPGDRPGSIDHGSTNDFLRRYGSIPRPEQPKESSAESYERMTKDQKDALLGKDVMTEEDAKIISVGSTKYLMYSLTRYPYGKYPVNLVSAIEAQRTGDCAKHAATNVSEIGVSLQYIDDLVATREKVGFPDRVQVDLSVAYTHEINGCVAESGWDMRSAHNRGLVLEEHYPYAQHYRWPHLRNTERWGYFPNHKLACTLGVDERNGSWNDWLYDRSVSMCWLRFLPGEVAYLGTSVKDEELVKELIRRGKAVAVALSISDGITTDYSYIAGELGGPFKKLIKLEWVDNPSMDGGHAMTVVGYLEGIDVDESYWLIRNSWGRKNGLWLLPFSSNFDPILEAAKSKKIWGFSYHEKGIKVYRGNTDITKNHSVLFRDSDTDGVADLFDNLSFCKTPGYDNGFGAVSCINPSQGDADGDGRLVNLDTCPYLGDNGSNVDGDYAGDVCDPHNDDFGLTAFSYDTATNDLVAVSDHGAQIGRWKFRNYDDRAVGSADFNGDGEDEFVLTSGYRYGVFETSSSDEITLLSSVSLNNNSSYWWQRYGVELIAVGDFADFNGSKAEILVRSPEGIGLVYLTNSGTLAAVSVRTGTWIDVYGDGTGHWTVGANDSIEQVGDFDNDGRLDFLIRSDWGLGMLSYKFGFAALTLEPWDTGIYGWTLRETDSILGVGRFSSLTNDALLIKNDTYLAVLIYYPAMQRFMVLVKHKIDGSVIFYGNGDYSWRLGAGDVIDGFGDVDGDNRTEVIIRSSWGIGVLEPWNNSWTLIECFPWGTGIDNSWLLDSSDEIAAFADVDGDSRDEFFIRSRWGMEILQVEGGHLQCIAAPGAYPHYVGNFPIHAGNVLMTVGHFNADDREDILVNPFSRM